MNTLDESLASGPESGKQDITTLKMQSSHPVIASVNSFVYEGMESKEEVEGSVNNLNSPEDKKLEINNEERDNSSAKDVHPPTP